jgi:hypothetical protein
VSQLHYLWREQGDGQRAAADIQRMIDAGEDADGLADLPIKDMLARLKAEFSGCKEVAGSLAWQSGDERWQATWGWQFLRLESDCLHDERRDKFFDLAREFGCSVFDPQLNLRM